jgi:hypothetical protein
VAAEKCYESKFSGRAKELDKGLDIIISSLCLRISKFKIPKIRDKRESPWYSGQHHHTGTGDLSLNPASSTFCVRRADGQTAVRRGQFYNFSA